MLSDSDELTSLQESFGIDHNAIKAAFDKLKSINCAKKHLPICGLLLLEDLDEAIPIISNVLEKDFDLKFLQTLQSSKYYQQRASVPKIIKNIQFPEKKEILRNSLKDRIIQVNREAVEAIVYCSRNCEMIFNNEELFDLAVETFHDKYVQRRILAIELLLLNQESGFLLNSMISDSSWRMRLSMARKLNQFNLCDQEKIIEGLKNDSVDEVRYHLCKHIYDLKHIGFMDDSDENVRAAYLNNNINLIDSQEIFDKLIKDPNWVVKKSLLKLNDYWFKKVTLPLLETMKNMQWRHLIEILDVLETRTEDCGVSRLLVGVLINNLKNKNNEIRFKSSKILLKILKNFDFISDFENDLVEITNSTNYRHRLATIPLLVEYDKKFGTRLAETLKKDPIDAIKLSLKEYVCKGIITGSWAINSTIDQINEQINDYVKKMPKQESNKKPLEFNGDQWINQSDSSIINNFSEEKITDVSIDQSNNTLEYKSNDSGKQLKISQLEDNLNPRIFMNNCSGNSNLCKDNQNSYKSMTNSKKILEDVKGGLLGSTVTEVIDEMLEQWKNSKEVGKIKENENALPNSSSTGISVLKTELISTNISQGNNISNIEQVKISKPVWKSSNIDIADKDSFSNNKIDLKKISLSPANLFKYLSKIPWPIQNSQLIDNNILTNSKTLPENIQEDTFDINGNIYDTETNSTLQSTNLINDIINVFHDKKPSSDEIILSDSEDSSIYTEPLSIPNQRIKNSSAMSIYLKNIKKIERNGVVLYCNDLRRLENSKWLNDKIINVYLDLMNRDNNEMFCFDTFFSGSLLKHGVDQAIKWIVEDKRICKIFNCKYLVFPIHSNSHWSILIFQNEVLCAYDSLNTLDHRSFLCIRSLLLNVLGVRFIKGKKMSNIPRQTNCDDCGVFACMYAKFVGYDLQMFESFQVPKLRSQMLHEILACKILYKN